MMGRRTLRIAALAALVIVSILALWIASAALVYPPEYVWRVLAWRESDVGDYLNNFPRRTLTASPRPFTFETAAETDRAATIFASSLGVDDLDTLLTETGTQSFIVIQDDRIVHEKYFNGWRQDALVTSFSVAKSFVSTLIGLAIEEGYISSVDDPVTRYLPELGRRDPRFERITIRHLLTMSSGLDYQDMRWFFFNGDDPLTTYHPDQRAISLSDTQIIDEPDKYFLYNKYHPQLLGMILERSTGLSVTAWTQSRLWDPLGMSFDGAWALDSTFSGFEKMEAGLNARPIDLAKLGSLFLHRGLWNGQKVISPEWVALATGSDPSGRAPAFDDERFYAFMWWGLVRAEGPPDFFAAGDHGQYIYVSPANHVVIVRTGSDYGISSNRWIDSFARAADTLGSAGSALPDPLR